MPSITENGKYDFFFSSFNIQWTQMTGNVGEESSYHLYIHFPQCLKSEIQSNWVIEIIIFVNKILESRPS